MNTQRLSNIARLTALLSFFIGTAILLLYFTTSDLLVALVGAYYAIAAALVNGILLLMLLISFIHTASDRRLIIQTGAIMLINIPVCILYMWFASSMVDIMRITFVNPTRSKISDIKITGCERQYIDYIGPEESKTKWIHIHGECGINIQYESSGQISEETVEGYLCSGSGKQMTYVIGQPNNPVP